MVWFDLTIQHSDKKYNVRYTPIPDGRVEYPYCDANGNMLVRVKGKQGDKGYFLNENNGEKHDKSFRLINGKATAGFTGRIKEVEKSIKTDIEETDDISIEDEYLAESEELYNDLKKDNKAIKFS